MKYAFDKEKFLKTELGGTLQDIILSWDTSLSMLDKMRNHTSVEERVKRLELAKSCQCLQAQWEVYKILFRQMYGVEYFFTRTDECVGVVDSNENFLFKVKRKI